MECFPVAWDNQAGKVSGPWPFGPSQVIQLHLLKLVEGVGRRCAGTRVVTKLWQGDRHCFSLKTPNCSIHWGGEYSGSGGHGLSFLSLSLAVTSPEHSAMAAADTGSLCRLVRLSLLRRGLGEGQRSMVALVLSSVQGMAPLWWQQSGRALYNLSKSRRDHSNCLLHWGRKSKSTAVSLSLFWNSEFQGKKCISLDHRVRNIDLGESVGIQFKIKGPYWPFVVSVIYFQGGVS